jgi:hypothetical protein
VRNPEGGTNRVGHLGDVDLLADIAVGDDEPQEGCRFREVPAGRIRDALKRS